MSCVQARVFDGMAGDGYGIREQRVCTHARRLHRRTVARRTVKTAHPRRVTGIRQRGAGGWCDSGCLRSSVVEPEKPVVVGVEAEALRKLVERVRGREYLETVIAAVCASRRRSDLQRRALITRRAGYGSLTSSLCSSTDGHSVEAAIHIGLTSPVTPAARSAAQERGDVANFLDGHAVPQWRHEIVVVEQFLNR